MGKIQTDIITNIDNYEPKTKWRWVISFYKRNILDSVNPNAAPAEKRSGEGRLLSYMATKASRPEFGIDKITTNHLNEYRHFAGKPLPPPDWSTDFIDGINNDGYNAGKNQNVGKYLYGWYTDMYNPLTGKGSYKNVYASKILVEMLDPTLTVMESWTGIGAFPTKVTLGDLDYTSNEKCTIGVSWSIDKWVIGDALGTKR